MSDSRRAGTKRARFDYSVAGAARQAVRLQPDDEDAWNELARADDRMGRYAKAVEAEKVALRFDPDSPMEWFELGFAYEHLGDYANAVDAEQNAILLFGSDKEDAAEAWYILGLAYKAQRRQLDVVKVYRKLKVIDPRLASEFSREAVLP